MGRYSLDSLASIGTRRSPDKALQFRPQWVASIYKRQVSNGNDEDNISDPLPFELVQHILGASEFISMLKQAKVHHQYRPGTDLEPILDYIYGRYLREDEPFPEDAFDNLLSQALNISTSILEQIVMTWEDAWEVELDDPLEGLTVEYCPEPAVVDLYNFVHACLVDDNVRFREIKYSSASTGDGSVEEETESDESVDHDKVPLDSLISEAKRKAPESSTNTKRKKQRKLSENGDTMITFSTPLIQQSNDKSLTSIGHNHVENGVSSDESMKIIEKIESAKKQIGYDPKLKFLKTTKTFFGKIIDDKRIVEDKVDATGSKIVFNATNTSDSNESRLISFKDKPCTPWTELTHVGHVSDYHGFTRNYASFVPLKFSKTLSEMQEEIQEAVNGAKKGGVEEERDEEEIAEMEDYALAIQGYQKNRRSEQRLKKRKSRQYMKEKGQRRQGSHESQVAEDLPIRFVTGSESMPTEEISQSSIRVADSRLPILCPSFKQIESDTIEFWQDEMEQGKRRSRRDELLEQKKISVMILREMENSLKFIEEYNNGFLVQSRDMPIEEAGRTENKIEDISALDEDQPILLFSPIESKIDHAKLLSNYDELRRRFQSSFPEPIDSTLETLKNTIMRIIKGYSETIPVDEEISREEKAQIRIRRGYNQKADQERIERKMDEDESRLDSRVYSYMSRSRKIASERAELEQFELRPLRFHSQAILKKKKGKGGCNLGPDCELCMPTTKTLLPPTCATSKATIHNPSFRRVYPDYLYEMDDEEKQKSHRTSRIGETIYRRRVSMMKLQEMYHTLEFIEKFNKGMIPSK